MGESERERFEIPQDLRTMAEASFGQARKAFETFVNATQQAASAIEGQNATMRANAKDISAKAIGFAEKNVQASLDYTQQLLATKDLGEIMRLHSEYVQAQMRALTEQASEIGQAISRAALDSTKPK
jgi:phasin